MLRRTAEGVGVLASPLSEFVPPVAAFDSGLQYETYDRVWTRISNI